MKTTPNQYKAAISVCQSCANICNTCSDDMIGIGSYDNQELMARCIGAVGMCRRLLVICELDESRVTSVEANLPFMREVCDACAVEACEQHAHTRVSYAASARRMPHMHRGLSGDGRAARPKYHRDGRHTQHREVGKYRRGDSQIRRRR